MKNKQQLKITTTPNTNQTTAPRKDRRIPQLQTQKWLKITCLQAKT